GNYPLKVRATGGNISREADLSLTVTIPPSFTLSLNPTGLTLDQGASGGVEVRLQRQGFTGPVSLSLEGSPLLSTTPAPDRIAWSFSPNPAPGDRSTLTLQVGRGVAPGTYTLTVKGQAQGQPERTANLTLTVRAAGDGGGGGGSGLSLPPPQSGQGFPQPDLQVDPPAGGAEGFRQGRMVRLVVTPQNLILQPGEERLLAVWAEDDRGNRYAGDPGYLELKVYNPGGYEVAWAGPGAVRVRAPRGYVEGTLFVTLSPRLSGVSQLNGVATATVAELRPGVR
ncbi:MAG: hypothetical protein NZ846_11770, partial [Thermus sp.]|nr:hypothetical protein [Thermus sp.]